jgi:DNA-binding response OmpR family regulator
VKVLVVDDERVIADTLVIILNQNGYQATAAYSGGAAVEQAQAGKPALVILDVVMPGMSGIEAAKRIRKLLPQCRILLFSGQPETTELLEHEGQGFEVLAKPVHPAELLAKLAARAPSR